MSLSCLCELCLLIVEILDDRLSIVTGMEITVGVTVEWLRSTVAPNIDQNALIYHGIIRDTEGYKIIIETN